MTRYKIIDLSKYDNVALFNHNTIQIELNGETFLYSLNKETKNIIYGLFDMNYRQGKDLYTINRDMWFDLFVNQLYGKIKNYKLVIHKSLMLSVGLYEDIDDRNLEFFNEPFDFNHISNSYERIIYGIVDDIKLIFELDYKSCKYNIYIERYLNDKKIFIPAFDTHPIFETNTFRELFEFDIKDEINTVELIRNETTDFNFENAKYSLREIEESFKFTKINVVLNDGGKIESLKNISENSVVVDYFNGFDFAYKTIKVLTHLQKSIIFADMHIIDFIEFYSKIYLGDYDMKISIWCINYLFSILENLDYDTIASIDGSKL